MLELKWPHKLNPDLQLLIKAKVGTLIASSIYLLQISGSTLPIQHSHTELKVTLTLQWIAHLATGLLHYNTSCAFTALSMTTTLLYKLTSLKRLCVVFLASMQIRQRLTIVKQPYLLSPVNIKWGLCLQRLPIVKQPYLLSPVNIKWSLCLQPYVKLTGFEPSSTTLWLAHVGWQNSYLDIQCTCRSKSSYFQVLCYSSNACRLLSLYTYCLGQAPMGDWSSSTKNLYTWIVNYRCASTHNRIAFIVASPMLHWSQP